MIKNTPPTTPLSIQATPDLTSDISSAKNPLTSTTHAKNTPQIHSPITKNITSSPSLNTSTSSPINSNTPTLNSSNTSLISSEFIHLRVLTSYSLLYSMNTIKQLCKIATEQNIQHLAITDKHNIFGSLEFSTTTKKYNIIPIIGALIPIDQKETEILLLAKTEKGYQNLLQIVSYFYQKKEYISIETLLKYNEDLIVLSGYIQGPIGYFLLENKINKAEYYSEHLQKIFGDRFYYEIMRHGLEAEQLIEQDYIQMSQKYNVPLVATNNVLFSFNTQSNIQQQEKVYHAHDTLLCIANNRKKVETERPKSCSEYYFKSPQEMQELFKDIPNAIKNTVEIAKRCSFAPTPQPPVLPKFCKNENTILKNQSIEGLFERMKYDEFANKSKPYDFSKDLKDATNAQNTEDSNDSNDSNNSISTKNCKNSTNAKNSQNFKNYTLAEKTEILEKYYNKYYKQIIYELEIICKMDFAGYFLIVSDFIIWAKNNNIFVGPGRGSGAGSIVAWSLAITNLNPIKYNLIFERFLNPERISMPDFDIDFCQEKRHKVIQYIKEKYGHGNVGQIITFGMLKPKAALKDIARVHNLPYGIANYLSNLVPFNQVKPLNLSECITQVQELANAYSGKGLYNNQEFNNVIKLIIEEALLLENIHRHVSIHAAGVVISPTPLINTIALYENENSNTNIIQYSMKYTEMIGLVKFDLLGLQTLTVLSKCKQHIKNNSNINLEFDKISDYHEDVFKLLSSGQTRGIFQFESSGLQQEITKFKPQSIFDIMALTSLYRPGPIENLPKYIARKQGKEKVEYLHPDASNLLHETYGIIIYQEQVLELAKKLAGYSLGSADILRKAMGKKNPVEMEKQKQIFIDGCAKNNISNEKASEIFKYIATFAGYGFNRAHAASYAVIAYYTAYLKHYHLQEFLISAMNLELHDKDRISLFCHDAKKNNIQIAKLSINDIELLFAIQGPNTISYALSGIKGMSATSAANIIHERTQNGLFTSLEDFINRCKQHLNKKILESLILSGCLDEFNYTRQSLFNAIEHIISYIANTNNSAPKGMIQLSMFSTTHNLNIKKLPELPMEKLLEYEFFFLNTFITQHPIDVYKEYLSQYQIKNSQEVYTIYKNSATKSRFNKEKIFTMGFIEHRINKISKEKQFSWLRLSDHLGEIYTSIVDTNVIIKYGHLLQEKQSVILECEIFNERIYITQAFPVQRLANKILQDINLYIPDEQTLYTILTFLKQRKPTSSISSHNSNNSTSTGNIHTLNTINSSTMSPKPASPSTSTESTESSESGASTIKYSKIHLYLLTHEYFTLKTTLNDSFKISLYDYHFLSRYKYIV